MSDEIEYEETDQLDEAELMGTKASEKEEEDPYREQKEKIAEKWQRKTTNALSRYRYVTKEELFFDTKTGQTLRASQLNTEVPGKFLLHYGPKADTPAKNFGKASQAFFESLFFKGLKAMTTEINSTRQAGSLTEDLDGGTVNTYVKRGVQPRKVKEIPELFEKYMDSLFEHEEDRLLMMRIMKWTIENAGNPVNRLKFAPYIVGPENNGKSTLITIVGEIIGARYLETPDPAVLKGNFSGFLQNALIINLNEPDGTTAKAFTEKVKPWITDRYIQIHPKGKEAYKAVNTGMYWITTNHLDAMAQSVDSTRFANFKTRGNCQQDLFDYWDGEKAKDDFFSGFYDWMEIDGAKRGLSRIAGYLKYCVEYGDFNGAGRAPKTKTHDEVLAGATSPVRQSIVNAASDLGGMFTRTEMMNQLKELGHTSNAKVNLDDEVKAFMKDAGYLYDTEKRKSHYFRKLTLKVGERNKQVFLALPGEVDPVAVTAKMFKKLRGEFGTCYAAAGAAIPNTFGVGTV